MQKTADFLYEYIDDNVKWENCDAEAKKKLSLYLSGAFHFYSVNLLGEDVLFIKPVDTFTPDRIIKWSGMIQEKWGLPVVLVFDSITPYMTKKLLKNRVGFVVPGKKISLPFLATYIKNESMVTRSRIIKFSPTTQMVFLHLLYGEREEYFLDMIASELGISAMSSTRSMRDLTDLGMLDVSVSGITGRKKVFKRKELKDFYGIGKSYLDSPVRSTIYVRDLPKGLVLPKADLYALGELTMLNESRQKCYALPGKDRKILKEYEVTEEQAMDNNLPVIQLTKYDVNYCLNPEYEDPVSLILGLSERDERIDMAIDELMEGMEWYEE